ncbi:MAG: LD-carboxypeptidase [Pseudanabaena sp. ELA607]
MEFLPLPPFLNPTTSKIRVITPSGALRETARVQQGLAVWQERGYQLNMPSFEELCQTWGYLAGADQQRAAQFREAWLDPDCDGIICTRGGYGGTRLLEQIDWLELAAACPKPKWLIGFSDITALLWSIAQYQKIASLHGPVLTTLASEPDWSKDWLFEVLEGKKTHCTLEGQPLVPAMKQCPPVQGALLPANLTLATHMISTPLCPDLNGVILAIEDVGEAPYRVDRMLTHWRWTGLLKQLRGIALGRFSQAEVSTPSFSMVEVWQQRLGDLGIPVIMDLPFGHDGANPPLVVGAKAVLDPQQGKLSYDLVL